MARRQVLFRPATREKILRGATHLAGAARIAPGPRSKSVLIQRKWGVPVGCNDGVAIAKELDLKDREENLGVQMLRQAAAKTGDVAGGGAGAVDSGRGVDKAAHAVVAALRERAQPVRTRAGRAQVATISTHNDPTVGELVADAMERIGSEGVITVEEAKTNETVLDMLEAMQFDRGYVSPCFVTNAEKMEADVEDARCLSSPRMSRARRSPP